MSVGAAERLLVSPGCGRLAPAPAALARDERQSSRWTLTSRLLCRADASVKGRGTCAWTWSRADAPPDDARALAGGADSYFTSCGGERQHPRTGYAIGAAPSINGERPPSGHPHRPVCVR